MGEPTEKKKNVHAKHRQRMIGKFMQSGLDIFADHEVIELLLYWILPRVNTNPIAHDLINTFGSIHGILEANADQLQQVDRIGPRSAQSFCFLQEFFRYYEQETISQKEKMTVIRSSADLGDYCRAKLAEETEITLVAVYMDGTGYVIRHEKIMQGNISYTPLTIRNIIEFALLYNAVSIALIHYYPHTNAPDYNLYLSIKQLLQHILYNLKVTLVDVLVLSPQDLRSLSF